MDVKIIGSASVPTARGIKQQLSAKPKPTEEMQQNVKKTQANIEKKLNTVPREKEFITAPTEKTLVAGPPEKNIDVPESNAVSFKISADPMSPPQAMVENEKTGRYEPLIQTNPKAEEAIENQINYSRGIVENPPPQNPITSSLNLTA